MVIPRRQADSFFSLAAEEKLDLLGLLEIAKVNVDTEFKPDSYNAGINDGPAAGQNIPNLHIHLIPRYNGDVTDPLGGVRWIIS